MTMLARKIAFAAALLAGGAVTGAPATTHSATYPSSAPASRPADGVEIKTFKIDPSPTIVTAHLKDVSENELFSKLGELGGFTVDPQGRPESPDTFSIDWDKVTIWQAIDETCEATKSQPQNGRFSDEPKLFLTPGVPHMPQVIAGGMLLRLQQIERASTVLYSDPKMNEPESIRITLQVLPEPRLANCNWLDPVEIDQARDDLGQALKPYVEKELIPVPAYASRTIVLHCPVNLGHRIAILSGRLPIRIVSKWARITFDHPLDHPGERTIQVGANQMILKNPRIEKKNQFHAKFVFKRGAGTAENDWRSDMDRFDSFESGLRLVLGSKQIRGAGGGRDGMTEITRDVMFFMPADSKPPDALQIDLPIDFVTTEAKFEFKDVPLP